ncbi:hypothetical protein [Arthrobacter sp. UYEF20]|uniref:hypothetical protein n=1 Tax=Arthrobacter sp. UYEF20 TaxID=1756363 RepID=UPI00339185BA
MDADDVVRLRPRGQQLREPFAATVDEAVRNLLAVQSQEFPYARWTTVRRTAGASAAAGANAEQAVSISPAAAHLALRAPQQSGV